ncbi:hypothetical protein V8J82_15535 [Gymnodinialimonas sp. 2305UL16-5]|uniref:hypothetical protein n=1 Tax=Gymnodinialimonas mytili TaxID=3126503 RepID=UPI0030B50851
MVLSLAVLQVPGAPAAAQDVPIWLTCSGMAEYTYWAYDQIQQAEGHTDHAERIRLLRISSGVFVQTHVEEVGCTVDRQDIRATIQAEANLASDYFGIRRQDGDTAQDILTEYDGILDTCIADVGADRFTRLMADFAENGPPCGWTE